MAKKEKVQKVSAIDAIIHPFQFEGKSTQTHSEPKTVRLGGTVKTVSVFNKKTQEWESVNRVVGGVEINASHRIRTGKTARERNAKVREKVSEPVVKSKKKK